VELYYLSGALKLAPGDHPEAGRQFCVCIGELAFHASAAKARLLEAIDAGADLDGIVARVNAGRAEALSIDAVMQRDHRLAVAGWTGCNRLSGRLFDKPL
jgi:hypothetical protein